jgi:glutathione S-transferase
VVDQHLSQRQWLELDHPTIADIACFPYIALAGDGKISLDDYPNVVKWIDRIKQLPKYIGMPGL